MLTERGGLEVAYFPRPKGEGSKNVMTEKKSAEKVSGISQKQRKPSLQNLCLVLSSQRSTNSMRDSNRPYCSLGIYFPLKLKLVDKDR